MCPFCSNGDVVIVDRTLQGTKKITQYRCRTCGKVWEEVSNSQIPAPVSPMPKRNTGTD